MTDDVRSQSASPSSSYPVRGFSVRDAMILVVATAVGAFGYRVNEATMMDRGFFNRGPVADVWAILFGPAPPTGSTSIGSDQVADVCAILLGPTLAALTAGLIVSRLLSPHPARRELFRQPGFAAGSIALAVTAKRFLEYFMIDRLIQFDDWFLAMEWTGAMKEVSLCVVITWPVLALAGCLKPERGWIDRASRTIAVLWVLAGISVRLIHPVQYWLARG